MYERQTMMTGEIIDNCCAASDHFIMTVRLPPLFTTPVPGQFVMVRQTDQREPLLSRPLSVFDFHRFRDHVVLEFLYRVVGRGTSLFSKMRSGDGITLFGPLGKGFTRPAGVNKALLVAGGVGVAPLHFLVQSEWLTSAKTHRNATFYIGARSKDLLIELARLNGLCDLKISTDDGSLGYHGTVTELLRCDIDGCDPKETAVFACGPTPMIRTLGRLLSNSLIPCQVSLEERMACGLGACLGCAIKTVGPGGKKEYRKVCQDGPVFDLREILPINPIHGQEKSK